MRKSGKRKIDATSKRLYIHITIPRLLAVVAVVVASIYSAQFFTPFRYLYSRQAPNTSAASRSGQSTPEVAPPTPPPSPAAIALSTIPHSAKPEPIVTAVPHSSVSGLRPATSSTSSPSSTSSGSSSGSTSSSSTPSPATTSGYTSLNWSGYLATISTYTAITGSWAVPHATSTSGISSGDAAWIGIGGVTSSDLIQVGTEDSVSSSGQEASAAFYELLPNAATIIPTLSITPGDNISASITETSSGNWNITITDTTTGKSYSKAVAYASSNSSAEWIEEDPSTTSNQLVPLDKFGAVTFTNGAATGGGTNSSIASNQAQPVTMISGTQPYPPVATPSALSGDGKSFSVTRDNTS